MLQFHNIDRPAALHRHEDLHRYLSTTVARPEVLTDSAYHSLSASEQGAHDRSRVLYLSGGILVDTPHLQRAKKLLTQSFAENIGRNSGHAGLMLSGDSTVGKTTTAKALMRYVFSQYGKQFPDFSQHDRIPVAYIEVPAGSTGKLLMKTFAHFLGLTVRTAESMVDIRNRVVEALNQAGTQLIVVDELQNLAGKSPGNGESVDVLKNLHNDLPATFVYAGLDLTSGEILAGTRGQQLSGRFNLLQMGRFTRSNPTDRAAWLRLVNTFEKCLPLRDHELGTLPSMSDYLFDRTNGSIGSLGRLLTGAAIESISVGKSGREQITLELLEEQILDIAAEDYYASTRRTVSKRSATKKLLDGLVSR